MDVFKTLLDKVSEKRRGPEWVPPHRLLALDPGETLGWSIFQDGCLWKCDQLEMVDFEKQLQFDGLTKLFKGHKIDVVVCEDYRIYHWKSDSHKWSQLITPRIIGAIELLSYQTNRPIYFQMAGTVKGFCNNKKLKEWGYYQTAHRHANDSIRHACYWLLFGNINEGG